MTEEQKEIKPGDIVVVPYAWKNFGPFRVRRISSGLVWLKERKVPCTLHQVIKLKPGQTVRQALRAVVPANQLCEICGWRPAYERHFFTVPVPKAFTRVCMEDMAEIKKVIRERVKEIVAEAFEEARKHAQQKAAGEV